MCDLASHVAKRWRGDNGGGPLLCRHSSGRARRGRRVEAIVSAVAAMTAFGAMRRPNVVLAGGGPALADFRLLS